MYDKDFFKFCGLLRKPKLYELLTIPQKGQNNSSRSCILDITKIQSVTSFSQKWGIVRGVYIIVCGKAL